MRDRTRHGSAAPEAAGSGFDRQDKAWFWLAAVGLAMVFAIFLVAIVAIWPRATAPGLTGIDGLPSSYSEDHRAYERDLAVLDARLRAADTRIASIGTLTAAVGIGFGALITVVVIFFALRNRESAIAAAREGVDGKWPELRDKITEQAESEIEALSARVRELESRVQKSHDEIDKIVDLQRSLTPQEKQDVAKEAEGVLAIPPRERSAGNWWTLVLNAFSLGDFLDAFHAACSMLDVAETPLDEARALLGKGVTLGQLGRTDEEIEAYEDVLARFGDATAPALQESVAKALFNKGITLGQLGRTDAAIAVYDDVLARFGDATEPALQESVAKALFNKGVTLGQLGRTDAAIAAYGDVLARFGDATGPALQAQVAMALVNKGVALGQLERTDTAIAAYDDVLARFGDATEPALQEQVAKALVNKGVALGQLGRADLAIASFDDVLARFGDATAPALQAQVARAYLGKAFVLKDTDIAAACAAAREAGRRLELLDTEDAEGLRTSVQNFLAENCPDQD